MRKLVKFYFFALSFVIINESVRAQGTSCIECDSNIDGEIECGSTLELINGTCMSEVGCFTRIYEADASESEIPGWHTKRGCVTSDLTSCEVDTCLTCNGTNCNNEIFPSNRNKCLKCNGDCSTAVSNYCNVILPNLNDCITFYDQNGIAIYKNCYSEIPTATKELCDESNFIDCTKCSGENCNIDVKRTGNKCYECNGVDCLYPIKSNIPKSDCLSSCYIGINEFSETVRGCAEDFPNTYLCSTNKDSIDNCFVCDGDGCNSIIYPKPNRLQCHTCNDENCIPSDNNIEYCDRYHADEKCASVFAENEDVVVARGCISSLPDIHKITCSGNSSNCLKCSYDKCNKDDSKLKNNFCIGCKSDEDPNCLNENTITEVRCSTDRCYNRLVAGDSGYTIQRGCTADLTTCSAPNCISCQGRNCNNFLYPANRISCKFCQNEQCTNPIDKICNNYIENESCVTFFDQNDNEKVIVRDCHADLPLGTREYCDDPTNLRCTKCTGNLCNNENKRRGNKCFKCSGIECFNPSLSNVIECTSECYVGINEMGEIVRDCSKNIESSMSCGVTNMNCVICDDDLCNGILYETNNRLICHKCNGNECESDFNVISDFCEVLNENESCVTIFDSSGGVAERGCSSTVSHANKNYCNVNDEFCLTCKFNNCNAQTSNQEKFLCVSCDSVSDSKCVSNPTEMPTVGCTTNDCFSRLLPTNGIGQQMERGCGASLTIQCSTPDCSRCTGERCNSLTFPSNRHSCYQCSGDSCRIANLNKKLCIAYNSADNHCVTFYGTDNQVIFKDCYIDAAAGTKEVCDDRNDLSCSKCDGNSCNTDTIRRGKKCVKCSGLDCFNVDLPANSVECITGGCYVGINSNGEMQRGCASSFANSTSCTTTDTENKSCLVCSNDYCNAITFPLRNRLICNKCNGDNCKENILDQTYCERLHQSETCVSLFSESNEIIERGCSSTISNSLICSENNTNCLKCGFDLCNSQNSKNEIHHCISCKSLNDKSCVTNSSTSIKSCTTNQCFSKLTSSENSWQYVEKGCGIDAGTCTGNSCNICTGDLCNNIFYPNDIFSCQHCQNDECKQSNVTTKYCSLYNAQKQACVTLYGRDNSVNYRGCYSDSAVGTQQVCDDSTELICTKCSNNRNCNIDTTRRGKKCFKCEGFDCFSPNYPADVVDCLSGCYVGVNSLGENVRGCLENFANSSCGSDDDGVHNCIVCNDDLCNGIQFPMSERLQCHKCNSVGCAADLDNLDYCETFGERERCVTVFNAENNPIERGCSLGIQNKNYCVRNEGNCIQCSTSGCNNIQSKTARNCASCDSVNDINCVINPTLIPTKLCEKGCYTKLIDGDLIRGCVEDLGSTQCNEGTQCESCNEFDKCNTGNYPIARHSCITCNGLTDCKQSQSQLCIKHKSGDKCVTIFNEYNVERKGCLADQTSSNQLLCSGSNALCSSCSTHNCNTDVVRSDESCINCDSAINSNCAQRPNILTSSHCLMPSNGECFTKITDGKTVRGCSGLLSPTEINSCRNETIASHCVISPGRGTNNRIIPQTRLKCFHCDSNVDDNCRLQQTNMNSTLPCKKFNQPENCIKISYSNGRVVRGCSADFATNECQNGNCQTCPSGSIKDGCNSSFGNRITSNFYAIAVLLCFIIIFQFKKV